MCDGILFGDVVLGAGTVFGRKCLTLFHASGRYFWILANTDNAIAKSFAYISTVKTVQNKLDHFTVDIQALCNADRPVGNRLAG